jgi:DNA-binding transcriptional ArsR family regulator
MYEHVLMDGWVMAGAPAAVSAGQRRRLVAQAAPQIDDLAEIFKILGDPTRLRVLTALADGGELCVHEICDRVQTSQPAVSHQLRTLRGARLVRSRRAGREVFYALDDDHVLSLLLEGLNHVSHGSSG